MIVAISGHFDPYPHVGHGEHIRDAQKLGIVMVILATDKQCSLKKKGLLKGFCVTPYVERKYLIYGLLSSKDIVVENIDKDDTSAESLRKYKPDIFLKGGDRTIDTLPESEIKVCQELGIEIRFTGEKIQSSSDILGRIETKVKSELKDQITDIIRFVSKQYPDEYDFRNYRDVLIKEVEML